MDSQPVKNCPNFQKNLGSRYQKSERGLITSGAKGRRRRMRGNLNKHPTWTSIFGNIYVLIDWYSHVPIYRGGLLSRGVLAMSWHFVKKGLAHNNGDFVDFFFQIYLNHNKIGGWKVLVFIQYTRFFLNEKVFYKKVLLSLIKALMKKVLPRNFCAYNFCAFSRRTWICAK